MSSEVSCDYFPAYWEVNSVGQDACKVYAKLQGKCDRTFALHPVLDSTYYPQINTCACNIVAYNLAAGCMYCQTTPLGTSWLSVPAWEANCSSVGFDATKVPETINTADIVIPPWALAIPTETMWVPAQASVIAVGDVNTAPNTTSASQILSIGISTTSTTRDDVARIVRTAVRVVFPTMAVVGGLCLVGILAACLLHRRRQNRRVVWSRPTAEYYMAQKRAGGLLPNPYLSVIEQYPSLVDLGPHNNSSSSSQVHIPLLHLHPTSDPSHSTPPHPTGKGLELIGGNQPTLPPTTPSSDVPPPQYRATLLPPQRSGYDEAVAVRESSAGESELGPSLR
ncbi:hypothetical protein M408DRAFT_24125 [Serendipita vermifera MAFF 305830]|uniref:Transmembrane protein n=1 Tax=Serendipita vermifera MAFF 305830 TaxID=933852 RepID=A0A0C3B9L9_SERVB|nr:hypothetical protein M408DRAFT_24125 [Serendipita vermifera MAFF 305830]